MSLPVLVATRNHAKAERIRRLLADLPLDLYGPDRLGEQPSEAEEGSSHLAIACAKAVAWSRAAKGLAVSSDGGVDMPVLGDGWRSLTTRRATGEGASDEERAARLAKLLDPYPPEQREVWWVEAVALAQDGRLLAGWEAKGLKGVLSGPYQPAPPAYRGFWVYGLWRFPALGHRCYWELGDEELRQADEPWLRLAPWLTAMLKRLAG